MFLKRLVFISLRYISILTDKPRQEKCVLLFYSAVSTKKQEPQYKLVDTILINIPTILSKQEVVLQVSTTKTDSHNKKLTYTLKTS